MSTGGAASLAWAPSPWPHTLLGPAWRGCLQDARIPFNCPGRLRLSGDGANADGIVQGRQLSRFALQVKDFEGWAAQSEFSGAGVVHADFGGLRGLMASRSVRPWETLVSVPLESTLGEDFILGKSSSPPPEPASRTVWERCPWWVRLAVRLLAERSKGPESRLAVYIGLLPLPREVDTPLHWSAKHLERLHYPHLLAQVRVQRRLFEGLRKVLLADVSREGTGAGDSALAAALRDADLFVWALESVLSRAYELPPPGSKVFQPVEQEEEDDLPQLPPAMDPPAREEAKMALLPLMDSINHYSRMPTHMYWEEPGVIGVSVGVEYDPGDHVFLSYGPRSNDDLLLYYGFTERDNPADVYVVEGMGRWLRQGGWLTPQVVGRLLGCSEARETWRYLRRGVFLRDSVHPATMQGLRILCCETGAPAVFEKLPAALAPVPAADPSADVLAAAAAVVGAPPAPTGDNGTTGAQGQDMQPGASPAAEKMGRAHEALPWDGTPGDLARFAEPVSLAVELRAWELAMACCAGELDGWAAAGMAAAATATAAAGGGDATAGPDTDLEGLGLSDDRRLMLSTFRGEKIRLLRDVAARLQHMWKISQLLNRPLKMPRGAAATAPAVLGPAELAGPQAPGAGRVETGANA